ncbi:hypothetical protein BKA70DRAFT_460542 [Coprinopsis sp. MPI-PUGE-AT-0042]|nr:hypothetical protein BKA70DRAFT_460542 [Coprinopsis sp. MPI-PUGE-AT-0042]
MSNANEEYISAVNRAKDLHAQVSEVLRSMLDEDDSDLLTLLQSKASLDHKTTTQHRVMPAPSAISKGNRSQTLSSLQAYTDTVPWPYQQGSTPTLLFAFRHTFSLPFVDLGIRYATANGPARTIGHFRRLAVPLIATFFAAMHNTSVLLSDSLTRRVGRLE